MTNSLGSKQHLLKGYGIIEKGIYYPQLLEYQKLYPEKQMLVLIFEEMIANPQKSLETVCEFLEIKKDSILLEKNKEVNKSQFSRTRLAIDYHFPFLKGLTHRYGYKFPQTKLKPTDTTLKKLEKQYEEPNQKLFELIGREIPSWKSN